MAVSEEGKKNLNGDRAPKVGSIVIIDSDLSNSPLTTFALDDNRQALTETSTGSAANTSPETRLNPCQVRAATS